MARLLLITTALVMAMLCLCSSCLLALRPTLVPDIQSLHTADHDSALPAEQEKKITPVQKLKATAVECNGVYSNDDKNSRVEITSGFEHSTSSEYKKWRLMLESEQLRQAPSGPDPLHHNGSPIKVSP